MLTTRLSLLIQLGCLAACATPQSPPPEHLSRKVAVLPVNNRTGDPLSVSGSGLVDRYVTHAESVSVSDVLQSEARFQLEQKGFEVVPPQTVERALKGHVPSSPSSALELAGAAGLGTLSLYLEIRRWEPEGRVHVRFVIVNVTATLVDPSTRQVVWQVERRAAPVPTPGEVMMESAYVTAARKVIAEILDPLRPDPTAPR